MPKNLDQVPVRNIIKLRKNHQTEFAAFQNHLAEFKDKATDLQGISDRKALAGQLTLEYQKTVKPSLDDVRHAFTLAKIDVVTNVMSVSSGVPAVGAYGALAFGLQAHPVLSGMTGFAVALIPTIQKQREAAKVALKTPGVWLLRVEEGLTAETFMDRVRKGARKFVLDV